MVASTGKDAEHAYLRTLGAAEVIGRDDLEADPGRTLGTERWAGAVDCVGGATLAAVLRTLRYGGGRGGQRPDRRTGLETSVYPFIVRGRGTARASTPSRPRCAERRTVWAELAASFPAHLLDDMVEARSAWTGSETALATIVAGRVRGRILVHPGR